MQPTFKLPTLDTAALCLADWLTNLPNKPGDDAQFVRLSHGDAMICLCATNDLDASEPVGKVEVPGYAAVREEADALERALNRRAKIMFYMVRLGRAPRENMHGCLQLVNLLRNTATYASLMLGNHGAPPFEGETLCL